MQHRSHPSVWLPVLRAAVVVAACLLTATAGAEEPAADSSTAEGDLHQRIVDPAVGSPDPVEIEVLDPIWGLANLYRDEKAALFQELSLIGRYHGQWWGVDSAEGSASDWENRRVWAGARLRFLDELALVGNFNLDPHSGSKPVRSRDYLDILTLAWTRDDEFQWIIGHQKPGFTQEYDLSSNRLLTLERSLLVNQIVPAKSPGIMFEQRLGRFHYRLGGYSGQEFGEDLRDPFALAALGYDLSELVGVDDMGVQLYYLGNSTQDSKTAKPYRHSFASSLDLENGPYSFVGQLMYADGFAGRPDAWGLTLMPARFIVREQVQIVARYQLASSREADGLQVQNRYERQVPGLTDGGKGDLYHAGYLGLNWYLYGNRLKIMTGIEYSHMRGGANGGDFDGWSGFAGLRLFF